MSHIEGDIEKDIFRLQFKIIWIVLFFVALFQITQLSESHKDPAELLPKQLEVVEVSLKLKFKGHFCYIWDISRAKCFEELIWQGDWAIIFFIKFFPHNKDEKIKEVIIVFQCVVTKNE